MTVKQQIKLLETQLSKINDMSQSKDYAAYKAWHKQTELLIKKIQGDDSDEAKEFGRLYGRSSVISRDTSENDRRHAEAYLRDLKSAHSLLTGLIEFIRTTNDEEPETAPVSAGTLEALHETVNTKCSGLYLSGNYAEAVEKGFKIVRDKLRDLTTYETGSEAFGKGHLYINGATADNVDFDFQQASKFLTMAIDQFRNEKSHTSDGKIEDPIRAYEYLALSSLAMHLLEGGVVKEPVQQDTPTAPEKPAKKKAEQPSDEKTVKLDPLQILALRILNAMTGGYKELISSSTFSGTIFHPLGDLNDADLIKQLNEVDSGEFEANLDQLAGWGILSVRWNKSGSPIYKLAKLGYDVIKEHPEFFTK
jgi:uncharacterized protein (TIGR02391 family)